jgi:hypothetical protein
MLPGVEARGTGPVVRVEATPAVAPVADVRSESADRFERVALGTAFQAQVLARLADGGFLVRVDNVELHMLLPQGTHAGDRLELTLAGTMPRPSFTMTVPAAAQADPAMLSPAGRLIDQILHSLPDSAAGTPLRGALPLVASPEAGAPRIAYALQGALERSGLFYESHVALWAEGAWPVTSLLQEPQAQAGRFILTSYPPAIAPAAPSGNSMGSGQAATSAVSLAQASMTGADSDISQDASAASVAPDTGRQSVFDVDAARLIAQQLGVLEQGQVRWQGECWPGQPMEWQLREDSGGKAGTKTDPEAQRGWSSTLRLELPRLGEVCATIHLFEDGVRMRLQVADPGTAQALRRGRAALADAVAAAGSRLEQLEIGETNMSGQHEPT